MKRLLVTMMCFVGLLSGVCLADDISTSIDVSNSTDTTISITLPPQSEPLAECEEVDLLNYIPYVIGADLYLPYVDIFDETHGIWLRYKAILHFNEDGTVEIKDFQLLDAMTTR